MRKRLLALCGVFLLSAPAVHAVDEPSELLADPVQEKRAEHLGAQLRCLVCQNESIEESSAPLAHDLRKIVREQIAAGRSDRQIMQWMTQRYGEFVRLAPRFSSATALLWFMPLLALGAGLCIAWRAFVTRDGAAPPPLSDEERDRLNTLSRKE